MTDQNLKLAHQETHCIHGVDYHYDCDDCDKDCEPNDILEWWKGYHDR